MKTTDTRKKITSSGKKPATLNKKETSSAKKTASGGKTAKVVWGVLKAIIFLLFCGIIGFQQSHIKRLENQVENSRYVYVYDVEEVLRGIRLDDLNREFEAKISILNQEVSSAQDKISTLKNSKVKEDFSDVYLKSLKLKRDNMVKEYGRMLQNITNEINEKVTGLALDNGIAVVFDKRFITVRTPQVIDLTDEIIRQVQFTRPSILDE